MCPSARRAEVAGWCGGARPGGRSTCAAQPGEPRGDRAAQAGLVASSASAVAAVRSRTPVLCRALPAEAAGGPAFPGLTVGNGTRGCVRFWEQNGSGGTLSSAVRGGHGAQLDVSDVQECRITADLPGCVLSSHRQARRCHYRAGASKLTAWPSADDGHRVGGSPHQSAGPASKPAGPRLHDRSEGWPASYATPPPDEPAGDGSSLLHR